MPEEVATTLQKFKRDFDPSKLRRAPRSLDEHGRAYGAGRRKASTARVYLVEGEGEIMINGKSLAEVLPRIHDRESALWALKVTSRIDKYNVWALVEGGGLTGQAEAITLALGRALLVHEPGLKLMLRKGVSQIPFQSLLGVVLGVAIFLGFEMTRSGFCLWMIQHLRMLIV